MHFEPIRHLDTRLAPHVREARGALADFDSHGDYEAPVHVLREFLSAFDQQESEEGK